MKNPAEEIVTAWLQECKRLFTMNNIKVPKIGYINDDNPTSFTYGSLPFNARIVYTQGIFTYLEPNEIKTVLAHEIGHVVHYDFLVMSIASVIIQIFYEIYRIGVRIRTGGKKKGAAAALIASLIGYVFYIIGTYILLYLSRIREYYADQFAVEQTEDPNGFSMALIKIAYGIVKNPEDKRGIDLLKSTRAYNIFDFKIAKTVGLAYVNAVEQKDWSPIEGAILFDKHNPWAFFSEISSTHPLTGKRLEKISIMAKEMKQTPYFDVDLLTNKYKVDKARMHKNFGIDLFFLSLPYILGVGSIAAYWLLFGSGLSIIFIKQAAGLFVISVGVGSIIRALYSYSMSAGFPKTTIENLMDDIYTSPIRGRSMSLKGRVIGRGVPGFIFSEDMMFRDATGLMYLNYENLLPFFGNLIFSFTKLDKIMGKDAEVEGWFVRGLSHRVELSKIRVEKKDIKSRVRLLALIFGLFVIGFGALIFLI